MSIKILKLVFTSRSVDILLLTSRLMLTFDINPKEHMVTSLLSK
jgi:hypothetical protein